MTTPGKSAKSKQVAAFDGSLDPRLCVMRHVLLMSRSVFAVYDRALDPMGVTGHQFNFLMTLYNVGPSTVGRIADILAMHGSSVPRAIAPMVAKSWISVTPAADRRKRIVAITPEGKAKLAQAMPLWERAQGEFLDRLGDAAWQESIPVLRAIGKTAVEIGRSQPAAVAARKPASSRKAAAARKTGSAGEAAPQPAAGATAILGG